jgi:hypothetical protein
MSKQRAFVRYTKSGKIVPGSMIITQGSYPEGPALWAEVVTDLCCDDPAFTTTSKMKGFVRYTQSGNIVPGSLILGKSYPTGGGLWREVSVDLCCNGTPPTEFVYFTVEAPASRTVNFNINLDGVIVSDLNITINWGDSVIENYIIPSNSGQSISHIYSAGSYSASILLSDSNVIGQNGLFELSGTAITSVDISSVPNLPVLTINNTSITGIDTSVNSKLSILDLTNNPITSFSNVILPTSPLVPIKLYLYLTQITNITLGSTDTNIGELYLGTNNVPGSVPLTSVVINQPPNLEHLRINGAASLTTLTLNVPSLVNLELYNFPNLTQAGLTLSNLTSLENFSSILLPLITSIDLSNSPSLIFVSISSYIGLTSVNLSNCPALTDIYVQNNSVLNNINITGSSDSTILDIFANAIPQANVNNLLITVDATGLLGGYFDVRFGLNSAPSGAGITAKNNLISKGWQVYTN